MRLVEQTIDVHIDPYGGRFSILVLYVECRRADRTEEIVAADVVAVAAVLGSRIAVASFKLKEYIPCIPSPVHEPPIH